MFDIHMHIIPNADDGARSMEESLTMIRMAVKQGVDAIIATPHSYLAFDDPTGRVWMQYARLKEKVREAGIPVRLYMGCEMYCEMHCIDRNLKKLKKGVYPTLNGTGYVLTEFDPHTLGPVAFYCVEKLLAAGYIPVIAHAERYHFINAETASALRDRGALIQINVYSVFEEQNDETRSRTESLLRAGLVNFTGSDAHRPDHRPPAVEKGIDYLYQNYDAAYINSILYGNARRDLMVYNYICGGKNEKRGHVNSI